MHEIACEAGVLETMYARNSFDKVDEQVNVIIDTSKAIGLRSAVKQISIGGGQGMIKCNCTSSCSTNRCSCRKANLLCNSRCHGGNSFCKNK